MCVCRLQQDLARILFGNAVIVELAPARDPRGANELILGAVVVPSIIERAAHVFDIRRAVHRFAQIDKAFEDKRREPAVGIVRILPLYDLRIRKLLIGSRRNLFVPILINLGNRRLFRRNGDLVKLGARRHIRSRVIGQNLLVVHLNLIVQIVHVLKSFAQKDLIAQAAVRRVDQNAVAELVNFLRLAQIIGCKRAEFRGMIVRFQRLVQFGKHHRRGRGRAGVERGVRLVA